MSALLSSCLSLAEVARYVACLSTDELAQLAEGPLVDLKPGDAGYTAADDCRVCRVLAEGRSAPARILLEWHDLVAASFEIVGRLVRDGEERTVVSEVQELFGALSYARCCTIYAAAAAELARRRAQQAQLGPLVDAIEEALPRNLYVRIGCGLEKASRPTIAATAALALQGGLT